jgi:HipA-like protein
MGHDIDVRTPEGAEAEFLLVYEGLPVGVLSVANGLWTFRYTDEFRKQKKVQPLVEFQDSSTTYKSRELWPFFAMRIPSLKRESVHEIVEKEAIDEKNEVELLRRFGKRTSANPFELVEK